MAKNAEELALLKKMLHELDARGQSDEKRLSEMNVNIENLNMNVSLQNRTVLGLVEDRKSPNDPTCFVQESSFTLTYSYMY